MLFRDNAVAYDHSTKSWIKGSLLTATQLRVGESTVGFVYMDDNGNSWVSLLSSAGSRVRTYFRGLDAFQVVPLAQFQRTEFHPLPEWMALEECPAQ